MSDILKSFPLSCLDAPRSLLVSCWKAWGLSLHSGLSAPLSGHLMPLLTPENPWPNYASQGTCPVFPSSGANPLDVHLSGEGTVEWSKELVGAGSKTAFFPPSSLSAPQPQLHLPEEPEAPCLLSSLLGLSSGFSPSPAAC